MHSKMGTNIESTYCSEFVHCFEELDYQLYGFGRNV